LTDSRLSSPNMRYAASENRKHLHELEASFFKEKGVLIETSKILQRIDETNKKIMGHVQEMVAFRHSSRKRKRGDSMPHIEMIHWESDRTSNIEILTLLGLLEVDQFIEQYEADNTDGVSTIRYLTPTRLACSLYFRVVISTDT